MPINCGPNILLITSEDTGLHFGCYGDPVQATPRLDRLAAEGTRFANAYTTQAVCSPGRASILTGLYPHQNGQFGLATHGFTMHRPFANLSTILKGAGFRTGRIGKLHVLPESAFSFDFVWNDPEHISFLHRDQVRIAEKAGDFMEEDEEPFFLMVNYPDAHLPFLRQSFELPAKPFEADEVEVPAEVGLTSPRLRRHTADYYSCISRLDSGIGLLLDRLEQAGRAGNTLVCFIADHGAQFSRGKGTINELGVKVPCIIRWPGVGRTGQVREELVSCIDVLPTILDAVGLQPPEPVPGRSLRPLLAGEEPDWRTHLFCEWTSSHPFPEPSFLFPQRSVRNDRYKLISNLLPDRENPVEEYYTRQVLVETGANQEEIDAAPEKTRKAYATWRHPPALELYDLRDDPQELVNLAEENAFRSIRDELLRKLKNWRQATGDPLLDPGKLDLLMAEDREVSAMRGSHRNPGFAWKYPDRLYPS
ncbi:MAG: sulfatase [Opitutaceae bacterium]